MSEPKLHGRRYNWELWFSQGKVILYKGLDYNCTTTYFAQYARRAAKRYGYVISVIIGDDEVDIVVNGKTEPRPEVYTNKYRKPKSK